MVVNACQVCGSKEWTVLPDPNKYQSVTTASRILNEPLGKSQCKECGFVQRNRIEFLGLTDYYEQDYATYYERPGTDLFHKKRYAAIVDWMKSFLNESAQYKKQIDIGCGQGWAMDTIREYYPDSVIEGVEPSEYNVKIARKKGFTVHEGKLEDMALEQGSYDLVFSNNVIQHVNSAKDFLQQLKSLVTDDGVIVVTCPDGAKPNIEILWGDQNFSFLPMNLLKLAEDIGFKTVFWASSASSQSLPPAQLLLMTNNDQYSHLKLDKEAMHISLDVILQQRTDYLSSFEKISSHILSHIAEGAQVYNFGASYWTSILAAYCPDYWKLVTACLIDEDPGNSKFLGKDVVAYSSVKPGGNDALVIGTGPGWQQQLKDKLSGDWSNIITWDEYINY